METPAYATKSGGELVLPEALEDLMDLEDQDAGGMKSNVKDKSMDLDIYHDLYDIEPAGSKKPDQMDRSLELDIYDDLDDFQKAKDRVSCAGIRPFSGVTHLPSHRIPRSYRHGKPNTKRHWPKLKR